MVSNRVILSVLVIFNTVTFVFSARVLCYFPNPSKSHVLLALPICEELANRGHNVVAVTNQKYGITAPNYREVVIPAKGYSKEVVKHMSSGKEPKSVSFLVKTCDEFVAANTETLKSAEFQKILKEETFDLIYFIHAFGNGVQLGIADHFNVPYIGFSPLGNIALVRDMIGSPSFPATVPGKFAPFPKYMNFLQRAGNFFGTIFEKVFFVYYLGHRQEQDYAEYWPQAKRSFKEMKRNISLIYYNQHVTQSKLASPLLPTEVEVGGIQISTKPKPLDAELQKWLDEAQDGAILWTFGTNVPMTSFDPVKLKIMLKVLGGLKQRVIMKWESKDLSGIPKNVLTREWLPQDSILAHKNVQLFVTHGGAGGCNEAMYHRVPILGIPFFGDQPDNVNKYVKEGWARGMAPDEITEDLFREATNDLLTNKKYRENVIKASDVYRDRIASALDTGVYWAEYVIKHHGALELSYAGKDLNFIQTYSLDVIAVVLIVIYIVGLLIIKLIKLIFNAVFARKSDLKTQQKKKKKQ